MHLQTLMDSPVFNEDLQTSIKDYSGFDESPPDLR